jgi:phosphatidylglycerophosphatase A
MGTLAAVPFYLLIVQLPWPIYLGLVLIACLVGVKICQVTADDMGAHDHGAIVWDEFAGLWITLSIVPLLGLAPFDWHWIATGFVLFRFFDMVKPWPISWLDKKVAGGVGIMVDDILAGIIAAVCLYGLGAYLGWLN